MTIKALILAAGVGARLGDVADNRPKALLEFGGKSLLRRHVEILGAAGIDDIVVGVGYRADLIAAELAALGPGSRPRTIANPRFREGSIVTLWTLREELAWGGEVLVMDADVLYDRRMMARLLASAHANCLLFDADFEPGDEPVKICVRGGRIVEFRKRIEVDYDSCGESVGLFRLSPATAGELAAAATAYVADGRSEEPYEEAIRDLVVAAPDGRFGYEDVTGLPWIEIDFADDLRRAESEIWPRLEHLAAPAPGDFDFR